MKHLQANWRLYLVLSLFLGLAIYFRAFLITNIFEPIAILFWAAWRILTSVHQNIYWMILILICSILMIRFVSFKRNDSGLAYSREYSPPPRVEDWIRLMKNASLGKAEAEYLRDSLRKLLISIHKIERPHSIKPDETVTLEAAVLPPTVRRFLFPEKVKQRMLSGDYRLQILFWTPKWFRSWVGKVAQTDNTAIEETLLWMESLLEINDDH